MRAVSGFDLDSNEPAPPHREQDGVRYQRTSIEKTFRGDLQGHGSVEMLAAQGDGGAGYVALEHIAGTIAGRSGGFALLHIGTLNGKEMWARWPIVPHSGTGDLRTIRGEGTVDIDPQGRHTLTLDYELD